MENGEERLTIGAFAKVFSYAERFDRVLEALRRALGDQARTVESDPAENCYVRESVSILSARCAS